MEALKSTLLGLFIALVVLVKLSSCQTPVYRFTPRDANDQPQRRQFHHHQGPRINGVASHNHEDRAASFDAPELAMTNARAVLSDEATPIEISGDSLTGYGSPIYRNTNELELEEPKVLSSHNIENAKVRLSFKDMNTAAGHHHHHGHYPHGWLKMGAHTGKKGSFGWHAKYPVGKGRR